MPAAHIAKDIAESTMDAPLISVTGCLPAFVRSRSSSPGGGLRAHADHAVLRVQEDLDAVGDELRDREGYAHAEVDDVAVLEVLREPFGDAFPRRPGRPAS